jgi:hypothetical protein
VVAAVVAITSAFMVVIPAIVVTALVTWPTIAVIAVTMVMPGAYHTAGQQHQGKSEHAQT